MLGVKTLVLPPVGGRRQTDQARPRRTRELGRERRMIAVRMGHENPADVCGRGQDALQMFRMNGSGIEHGDLAISQQVGIGAGAGHETCVAGETIRRTPGATNSGFPGIMLLASEPPSARISELRPILTQLR